MHARREDTTVSIEINPAATEIGTPSTALLRAPDLSREVDNAWRIRADKVLPRGMYGHIQAAQYPAGYPQFFGRSSGARIWDVDDNEYIDLMCSWGPMILGYGHPGVTAAYDREVADRDMSGGPSPRAVELAELFVDVVGLADWAVFAKNGGDVTTLATTVARAATGRKKVLKAVKAYHGCLPWCTPVLNGVTPEDRANLIEFIYNDIDSLTNAVQQAGDDLAAIVMTPHRHETYSDQVLVQPEFARSIREICDRKGAVMILDDVRSGFRVSVAGSWEPLGVSPDLAAYSKCIANGYPLAALTGVEALKDAMGSVYATGSFWYGSGALAAGIECIKTLVEIDGPAIMADRGNQLMNGLRQQAASHGISVAVTGPPAMPYLRFEDGKEMEYAFIWCADVMRRGVNLHPWHNWFLSTAHTERDIAQVLDATDRSFQYLASCI